MAGLICIRGLLLPPLFRRYLDAIANGWQAANQDLEA
jgi:hypothetical protein